MSWKRALTFPLDCASFGVVWCLMPLICFVVYLMPPRGIFTYREHQKMGRDILRQIWAKR